MDLEVRALQARVEAGAVGGASCVWNGLATKTTSIAKNAATTPSTGTTQAMSSRPALRSSRTAAAP